MWLEAISGLRINLDKSELFLVGCVENAKALAAELGCKIGSLPSSYLGLSLGVPYKFVVLGMDWRRVVCKDAWMKDVWSSTNGGRSWSLQFSRPFNDWEVDEVHRFLLGLNGKSVLRDVEDKWVLPTTIKATLLG
ncbi:hypothetical protein CK203_092198 [Vitis vinifera]|uniref:Reverse transcriptase domain-containing protein n=1 Tax=Vitis vinifera TaxID=29760 RepID=A0A438F281_VITVI|nr:hypothetical protein CK203_092198 [Vitis vinifera]